MMEGLYPNLYDRFKSEGLCPICLLEMEQTPKFTCENDHTVCYRCKPYYYACPTCRTPFTEQAPPTPDAPYYSPPPTHFMPHPLPRQRRDQGPSAPTVDFLEHERQAWLPPYPPEDQELRSCSYAHLGCWIKVPEYLQDLHESRCQFRPYLEEEHLPTDLPPQEDLVECKYQAAGCNVRTTPWRRPIHEDNCTYKEKYEAMNDLREDLSSMTIGGNDSDELVECKYRKYGCMVNMPRRRKSMHQIKCNYSKYHKEEDDESNSSNGDAYEYHGDPDEQVPCRWAEFGCRVKPKRSRLPIHEEKCNYRREECGYGCGTLFEPSRRFLHERSCGFANL